MSRVFGLDMSHEARAFSIFRQTWQPLTQPALIALLAGVVLNWIFLSWSTVAAGDSGPVLFGRVLASMILLVVPAILFSLCIMLLTVMAGTAWDGETPDLQHALAFYSQNILEFIGVFGVLVGSYMLFSAIFAFAGWFMFLLLMPTLMFAEFVLPAIVLGRIQIRRAFVLGCRFVQMRPVHLARGLLLPGILALAAAWIGEGVRANLWLGDILAAAGMAFALSYSMLVLIGWYRESYDDAEAPSEFPPFA